MEIMPRVENKGPLSEKSVSAEGANQAAQPKDENGFDRLFDHLKQPKEKQPIQGTGGLIIIEEDKHILPITAYDVATPEGAEQTDGENLLPPTPPFVKTDEGNTGKTEPDLGLEEPVHPVSLDYAELSVLFLHVQEGQKPGEQVNKQIVGEPKVTEINLDVDLHEPPHRPITHHALLDKQIQSMRLLIKELTTLDQPPTNQNLTDEPLKGMKGTPPLLAATTPKTVNEPPALWNNVLSKLAELNGEQTKKLSMEPTVSGASHVEAVDIKSDAFTGEFKQDAALKTDSMKMIDVKEMRVTITKEVEQYVEMKMAGPKKIILQLNQGEYGRLEIHIQKVEDKVHILLKAEDKMAHDKLENLLESLKTSLKDKQIDVEYEVEKENDQQREKRKEQEEQLKKENKEKHHLSHEKEVMQFDELLEVIQ